MAQCSGCEAAPSGAERRAVLRMTAGSEAGAQRSSCPRCGRRADATSSTSDTCAASAASPEPHRSRVTGGSSRVKPGPAILPGCSRSATSSRRAPRRSSRSRSSRSTPSLSSTSSGSSPPALRAGSSVRRRPGRLLLADVRHQHVPPRRLAALRAATCSTSGSSATTSRTVRPRPLLLFYLAVRRSRRRRTRHCNPSSAGTDDRRERRDRGVMGAYFVLYPHSRVLAVVFIVSSSTSSRSRRSSSSGSGS